MPTQDVVAGMRRVSELISSIQKHAKGTGTGDVVHLAIYVDETAPHDIVTWVRDAFVPERDSAIVDVERVGAQGLVRMHSTSDLAIVIAGESRQVLTELVLGFLEDGLPVAVVAESALDAPDIADRAPEGAKAKLVTATSEATLREKLASWIVEALPDDLLMAVNFPFVRAAKADQLVATCASENLLVGLVSLGRAQMPIMTANQARLALSLTTIYGRESLDIQIPELIGVYLGGYALRGGARLAGKALPSLGVLVRTSIAFGGTFLVGKLLRLYLDVYEPAGSEESLSSTLVLKE
jgi:uncharacterized protein (DUF697 family)